MNKPQLDEPLTWWRAKYGLLAPIGYELREHAPSQWTRVHSLPNAKRYPQNRAEYAEVSKRAQAISEAVFTRGEQVFGYHSAYAFDDLDRPTVPPELSKLLAVKRARFEIEGGQATVYTQAFVCEWPLADFDRLVHHVADENITMLTFVSPTTRNALCPYDGGFDLITHSPPPEALQTQFGDWLLPRDDYL